MRAIRCGRTRRREARGARSFSLLVARAGETRGRWGEERRGRAAAGATRWARRRVADSWSPTPAGRVDAESAPGSREPPHSQSRAMGRRSGLSSGRYGDRDRTLLRASPSGRIAGSSRRPSSSRSRAAEPIDAAPEQRERRLERTERRRRSASRRGGGARPRSGRGLEEAECRETLQVTLDVRASSLWTVCASSCPCGSANVSPVRSRSSGLCAAGLDQIVGERRRLVVGHSRASLESSAPESNRGHRELA
jgi:hypothetical protein